MTGPRCARVERARSSPTKQVGGALGALAPTCGCLRRTFTGEESQAGHVPDPLAIIEGRQLGPARVALRNLPGGPCK